MWLCECYKCVNFVGCNNVERLFTSHYYTLIFFMAFVFDFLRQWINFLTASNKFPFFCSLYIIHPSTIHILWYIRKGLWSKKNVFFFVNSIYTTHLWWKSRFNARLAGRVFHVVLFVMCEGKIVNFFLSLLLQTAPAKNNIANITVETI